MITEIVSAEDSGLRLDRWFKLNKPEYPFVIVAKLARKGKIKIEGKKAEICDRVHEGQKITFFEVKLKLCEDSDTETNVRHMHISSDFYKKNLIFSDDDLTIINKPSGFACQGGSKTPFGIDTLAKFWPGKPLVVHRIDKDTSGIMIMANTRRVAAILARLFASREVTKEYIAVLEGKLTSDIIDRPILENGEEKSAMTRYKLLQFSNSGYSLVTVSPFTGRKHQIRIHSAMLGTPVVGDRRHNIAENKSTQNNMMLHSYRISFELFGEKYSFCAPISDDLALNLREFGFKDSIINSYL